MTSKALVLNGSAAMPAHLAAMGALGNENMDSKVLSTPRLSLLQQLSPQVTKGKSEFVPGAEAGQYINSLTNKLTDELYVANLFMQAGYTAFKKRTFGVKDFQGNHASVEAAQAAISAKGLNPMDYDISENHTHTLAVIDAVNGVIETPILFSLKSSGLSTSRNWNSQIVMLNPDVPRFASIWKLDSVLVNGAKGSYYQSRVAFAGWSPATLADELKALFTNLHGNVPLPQEGPAF